MKTQMHTEQEKQSFKYLKKLLKPGTLVYTNLIHRSASGMSRIISMHIPHKGMILDITWHAAQVMGSKMKQVNNGEGICVGGCGMDMGFHLVYTLGHYLFPRGFKLAKNQHGRNGDTSGFDSDGGYSLKQTWL